MQEKSFSNLQLTKRTTIITDDRQYLEAKFVCTQLVINDTILLAME